MCQQISSSSILAYLTPSKYLTFWKSIRLYSPVELTGNKIEKLVSGGTGTGDLPILSPTR